MIADSFLYLVIKEFGPAKAISLPEVVFGRPLGDRIKAAKNGFPVDTPVLLYDTVAEWVVEAPCVVEIECKEQGWQQIDVVSRAEVPVGMAQPLPADVTLGIVYDLLLYSCTTNDQVMPGPTHVLKELRMWPELTLRESLRMQALPYLRRWIQESRLEDGTSLPDPIPQKLVPTLSEIGRKAWIDDNGKLCKTIRCGFRVEIVDSAARLREVLLLCHKGMGHRQLCSVYDYFIRQY